MNICCSPGPCWAGELGRDKKDNVEGVRRDRRLKSTAGQREMGLEGDQETEKRGVQVKRAREVKNKRGDEC